MLSLLLPPSACQSLLKWEALCHMQVTPSCWWPAFHTLAVPAHSECLSSCLARHLYHSHAVKE